MAMWSEGRKPQVVAAVVGAVALLVVVGITAVVAVLTVGATTGVAAIGPAAAPTVTVTARPLPAPTVTVTVTASAAPESQPIVKATPQGSVGIDFSTGLSYTPTCSNTTLTLSNRSDTAVRTVRVKFKGEDRSGAEIDLGWRTYDVGLAPFEDKQYRARVCDDRMHDDLGPAAIPTDHEWTWFDR